MITPDDLPNILSDIEKRLLTLGEEQLAAQINSILGYSSVTSEFYGYLRQELNRLREADVLKKPDEIEKIDSALELADYFGDRMFN